MNSKSLLSIFIIINSTLSFSQKIDESYTNYYKEPIEYQDEHVDIFIKNIAGQFDYCKFAIKLENITKDYLIFDAKYSKLVYSWGTIYLDKPKDWFLKPGQKMNEVFDYTGDIRFIQDSLDFVIEKLIKVPAKGTVLEIENAKLIANDKLFENDDVRISIKKADIKPKKNSINIKIENLGENYLYVNPIELRTIIHSDTSAIINEALVGGRAMIEPGKSKNVTLVFDLNENPKYINFEEKIIEFHNFIEVSVPIVLDPILFNFQIERAITYRMNK